MELLVASGIALVGYAMRRSARQGESELAVSKVESDPTSWNSDVYESHNQRTVDAKVRARAKEQFEAQSPMEFTRFAANAPLRDELLIDSTTPQTDDTVYSQLSGQSVNKESFVRNKQAYYTGKLKTHPDEGQASAIMHAALGYAPPAARATDFKSETLHMGDVRTDAGNVYGNASLTDFRQGRIVHASSRAMERPFDPVHVGPGLGADGYASAPSAKTTLNDEVQRSALLPRSVDDTRSESRPKLSFAGRLIPGQKGSDLAPPPELHRNRPDVVGDREHQHAMLPTGGGVGYARASARAPVIVRDTARSGGTHHDPLTMPPERVEPGTEFRWKPSWHREDDPRARGVSFPEPAGMTSAGFTCGDADDFGRGTMRATRRDYASASAESAAWTNVSSTIQAAVAPFAESVRLATNKEILLDRASGNERVQVQRPSHMPAYDPEHAARVTLKETNVHDVYTGVLSAPRTRSGAYDPEHAARVTLKETNVHDVYTGVLSAPRTRSEAYDPEHRARVTLKETNVHDVWDGVLSAPRTRSEAYDPETYRPQYTMKDASIHDTHGGQVRNVAFAVAQRTADDARSTHRQTLAAVYDGGHIAPAAGRGTTHEPDMYAKPTVRQTTLHEPDSGGARGFQRPTSDPHVRPPTHAAPLYEGRAHVDASNRGDGYLVANTDLRTAPRASLVERRPDMGHAFRPSHRTGSISERTATESGALRQGLNVAYHSPTPTSVKVAHAGAPRCAERRAGPLAGGAPAELRVHRSAIPASPRTAPSAEMCMPFRPQPPGRMDPELLVAFRKNPLTKPLDSVA